MSTEIKLYDRYYTKRSLSGIISELPNYLINHYITEDFILVDTEYINTHTGKYDYRNRTDEYTLTMHRIDKSVPTTYHIFVPMNEKGNVKRAEYNKIIATIFPAIYDDYKNYIKGNK